MSTINSSFEFLGTMAGNQTFLVGNEDKPTYARQYSPFGASDDLRQRISNAVYKDPNPIGDQYSFSRGWKSIGEEYSFTPWRLHDGRSFGITPGSLQGGGFFLTTKELKDEETDCSSFEYALSTFGDNLETIAKLPMQEILSQCHAYGIDYIIYLYFQNIEHPEDGDLVLYESTQKSHSIATVSAFTHAGIYRKSKPNWNSPMGGTIESKWSWFRNRYVFQHDVFFVPDFCGDSAKFYRIKKQATATPLHQIALAAPSMFTVDDDYFHFSETHENVKIRNEIDKLSSYQLTKQFPQIVCLNHIKFFGLCYHYAFGKILKTYSDPYNIDLEGNVRCILEDHFIKTTNPSPGDLAVYYRAQYSPVHYGVYQGQGIVESKWGSGYVYQHPAFYVPNLYGNFLVFYKMRSDFTPEALLKKKQK